MRFDSFTDLGLQALTLLAERRPESLSAAEIADQLGVSRHHLAKVLQALVRTGCLQALRGVHGGVRLAREPETIRIGDVVRMLDRRGRLECFAAGGADCALLPHCRLKRIFAVAQLGFLRELDRYTLSDMIEASSRPSR